MSEIYYIRHALTQWNIDGRLQGRSDIPLCEKGIEQVRLFVPSMMTVGIEKIISSPLQRTFETGKIIAEALGVPLETDTRLVERSFGTFEGIYRQTLIDEYGLKPGQPLSDVLPPDAESLDAVASRAWPVLDELSQKPVKVLIVSHAAVFRALWKSRIEGEFSELTFGKMWQFINNKDVWSANYRSSEIKA